MDTTHGEISLDNAILLLDTDRTRALSAIYHATIKQVYGYVVRRVGVQTHAEDITSDTYMTFLGAVDKYDRSTRIQSFLIGIARNKMLQFWEKNPQHKLLDEIPEPPSPSVDPYQDCTDEEDAIATLAPHLETVLASLSDQEAQVLRLRFQEVLSPAEIAERLETSPGNVRVIQHRALKKAAEHARKLIEDKRL